MKRKGLLGKIDFFGEVIEPFVKNSSYVQVSIEEEEYKGKRLQIAVTNGRINRLVPNDSVLIYPNTQLKKKYLWIEEELLN